MAGAAQEGIAGARFAGRLAGPGAGIGGERHAGCEVLLRGHVSNRRELAGLLSPREGAEASDAELLALAYRRWGERLQTRVDGEFAAAIRDEATGDALLTHDRTGLLSLFHTESAGGVEFATHLADLVDGTRARALDEDYLADHMAIGMFATGRTPYAGVARLLPGHSVRVERGRARVVKTWDLAHVPAVRYPSQEEYESRLRELLVDAVGGAAARRGRVAADLSGGLDSSTVVSIAATAGIDLETVSFVFPRMDGIDEQSWMRDVEEMHGVRRHVIDAGDVLPFAELPRAFFAEPSVALTDVARARRKDELLEDLGIDVLLTGAGGDAVFRSLAHPRHLADPLYRLRLVSAARELAHWRKHTTPSRSWLYWVVRHVLQPSADHLRGRATRPLKVTGLPSWIRPEYARATRLERRARRRLAPRCRTPGLQEMCDELWIMCVSASAGAQRPAPYEVRRPLLHAPLVEFMVGVPWDQKLRPHCDRYLQRRALRGILPESVRLRGDKGTYSQAVFEGLRRNRDWTDLLTDSPRLAERGIVDLERWREAVAQARFGRTHTDKHFLAAVSLEAWLQGLEGRSAAA